MSPTVNGLSKNIVKDPSKFSRLSLDANATATPPIPRPAASAVISIPKIFPRTIKTPNITTKTFPISIAKGINWSSTLLSVLAALWLNLKPTYSTDCKIIYITLATNRSKKPFSNIIRNPNSSALARPNESGMLNILNAM